MPDIEWPEPTPMRPNSPEHPPDREEDFTGEEIGPPPKRPKLIPWGRLR